MGFSRPMSLKLPPIRRKFHMSTPEQLQKALESVIDPNTGKDFVSTKALKNLVVEGGNVAFDVELGYPAKSQIPGLRNALIAAAKQVPGVTNVSANVTMKIVARRSSARRGLVAAGQKYRRCGLWQRWRWQEHHRCQFGAGAGR
jgi:metal-sulfur cluster biosynthetic enzyme